MNTIICRWIKMSVIENQIREFLNRLFKNILWTKQKLFNHCLRSFFYYIIKHSILSTVNGILIYGTAKQNISRLLLKANLLFTFRETMLIVWQKSMRSGRCLTQRSWWSWRWNNVERWKESLIGWHSPKDQIYATQA